jgi:5-methyltetrahydropteroyltriglutamate--homocysteine methyltransferase
MRAETTRSHCGRTQVQLDFTEGRLSVKLDPSKQLLGRFIALNNRVLDRFSDSERERLGIHTSPGSDQDSAHSLDVPYHALLPSLPRIETAVLSPFPGVCCAISGSSWRQR